MKTIQTLELAKQTITITTHNDRELGLYHIASHLLKQAMEHDKKATEIVISDNFLENEKSIDTEVMLAKRYISDLNGILTSMYYLKMTENPTSTLFREDI